MIKNKLVPAKDWIIENQNESGSIYWDHRGKCDPWDHCECLIALAIYEAVSYTHLTLPTKVEV